jgi:hypothetical protein
MAGRKSKQKGQIEGQSPNPNGQPHMRRLQGVLNAKYAREAAAVEALDWARSQVDPETHAYFADRVILSEALIALGEKLIKGYQIPSATDSVVIPEQALHSLTAKLGGYIEELVIKMIGGAQINGAVGRDTLREDVHVAVNKAISTSNLAGESYKYEDEDE